jgi:cyclic-di-AMP phosphodiesterase PgpH
MIQESKNNGHRQQFNHSLVRIFLLLVTALLSLGALVLPIATRPSSFPLAQGDVAPQDIQAPYALTFASQVQTFQARDEAEQRVAPVYLPADPAIARQQIELLRASLNFISTVRADTYATTEQKLVDLSALENIALSRDEAERILTMSEPRWQVVQQEAKDVLEQVMRNTIREGQMHDFQRSLPSLISFTLPQDQATIVAVLVSPFVTANSLYNEELTSAARAEARERVEPVNRSYMTGETIVRRGQIITPLAWEALIQFGLIQTPNNIRDIASTALLVTIVFVFAAQYFIRRKLPILQNLRGLALVAITFVIFLYLARLAIPNRTIIPYIYPLPAFGLVISVLFSMELAMVLALVLSILAAFGLPNSMDLTIFYILSSMFGILILGKGHRIGSFFWAGMGIGAAGSFIVMAYRLPDMLTDFIGLSTLVGAAFFNGMASASLALLLQFLFSQILGMATALQLLDISRPDHPLQQFILQNAPGSYQHSLQVAIMAEQAAEKIGADALLVRVGAVYHDAGKALNPSFYIENQIPGKLNPHDDLDPAVSAQTIIRHVPDGVLLARKYRMPSRIVDFILEHHGTLITRYQYAKALQAAGNEPETVNLKLFRYPGPRPQSRETALMMLADGVQARARAELPQDEEEQRNLVRKVVEFCQHEGQLDDTLLTLRDLNIISESFVKTLQNTYHPRIRYPEIKQPAAPAAAAEPAETPEVENPQPLESPSP